MMLKINEEEFEDGMKIILRILHHDFEMVDFYVDDKEIIHVTFKRKEDNDHSKH